jgi:hypothetical protein
VTAADRKRETAKWIAKAALGVAVLAVAWVRSGTRSMHSAMDRGVGVRCPQCEVAVGQNHLRRCAEAGTWRGRPRPPGDDEGRRRT